MGFLNELFGSERPGKPDLSEVAQDFLALSIRRRHQHLLTLDREGAARLAKAMARVNGGTKALKSVRWVGDLAGVWGNGYITPDSEVIAMTTLTGQPDRAYVDLFLELIEAHGRGVTRTRELIAQLER